MNKRGEDTEGNKSREKARAVVRCGDLIQHLGEMVDTGVTHSDKEQRKGTAQNGE